MRLNLCSITRGQQKNDLLMITYILSILSVFALILKSLIPKFNKFKMRVLKKKTNRQKIGKKWNFNNRPTVFNSRFPIDLPVHVFFLCINRKQFIVYVQTFIIVKKIFFTSFLSICSFLLNFPTLCYFIRSLRIYLAFNLDLKIGKTTLILSSQWKCLIITIFLTCFLFAIPDFFDGSLIQNSLKEYSFSMFHHSISRTQEPHPHQQIHISFESFHKFLSQFLLAASIYGVSKSKVNQYKFPLHQYVFAIDTFIALILECFAINIKNYVLLHNLQCYQNHFPLVHFIDSANIFLMFLSTYIVLRFVVKQFQLTNPQKHESQGSMPFPMVCSNFSLFLTEGYTLKLFYQYLKYLDQNRLSNYTQKEWLLVYFKYQHRDQLLTKKRLDALLINNSKDSFEQQRPQEIFVQAPSGIQSLASLEIEQHLVFYQQKFQLIECLIAWIELTPIFLEYDFYIYFKNRYNNDLNSIGLKEALLRYLIKTSKKVDFNQFLPIQISAQLKVYNIYQ